MSLNAVIMILTSTKANEINVNDEIADEKVFGTAISLPEMW